MKISEIITMSIIAIAIAATTAVTTSGLLLSRADAQQAAAAQPTPPSATTTTDDDDDDDDDDDNTATAPPPLTTTTTPANMTAPPTTTTSASSTNKTFYLFNDEVDEDLDDDGGIQGQGQGFTGDDDIDIYSLQTMVVNLGDTVTVNFFNVDDDDSPERHSFTMAAPYNIDADLASGESTVVTFTANNEGIFQYYSKYNMPQMTGQLVVLP